MVGVALLAFILQSCQSKPEEDLLKRYFHAASLNDMTTMSTMALEPVDMDVEKWKIAAASEVEVNPPILPELNKKELELKKKVEESVVTTLDARDALDVAEFELENARTSAAKRAARKKVDDLKAEYDEIYEIHKQLQKDYNEAKTAAAREEEITMFSLGARELPNVREFTGEVYYQTVDVKVTNSEGEEKTYRFYLRRYNLKDESLNVDHRGRWIIVDIESLS